MKTRNIINTSLILSVILFIASIIYLFRNDMKKLSIIFVSLSGLAVITAIIFEGDLKNKGENTKLFKLTTSGMFLVLLSIVVSVGNGIISYRTIVDDENKSNRDSTSSMRIINDLKDKKSTDSTSLRKIITGLKEQRKADSLDIIKLQGNIARLDTTLLLNAVKALEEQRQIVERANENTYILFRNEVEENLNIILVHYDDKVIETYRDTTIRKIFTSKSLSNEFANKFLLISNNSSINEYIMNTIGKINTVNGFALTVFNSESKNRNYQIDQFILNKEIAYNALITIYNMTDKLTTYKSFISSERIFDMTKSKKDILKENIIKRYKIKQV